VDESDVDVLRFSCLHYSSSSDRAILTGGYFGSRSLKIGVSRVLEGFE
jgi:hypothetical protein